MNQAPLHQTPKRQDWTTPEGLCEIAKTMRQLSLAAGQETLVWFGAKDVQLQHKEDESPLTAADLAANKVIVEGLRQAWPDIPIVSEEDTGESVIEQAECFFLVDPLDGTKEFISGSGEYTVNIALVIAGVPRLGVVYAPALKRLFWTSEPGLAVEESEDGIQQRLQVAKADHTALRIVASRSHRNAETEAFIAGFAQAEIKSAGSSLKFCLVAIGEADLYPRFGRTNGWDTAAGHAVLQAAGGEVLIIGENGAVGSPLRYDLAAPANPFFLACSPTANLPE